MATTDSTPIIKVLITMHPGVDALDLVGPLEVLSQARHNINDDSMYIFMISMDVNLSILLRIGHAINYPAIPLSSPFCFMLVSQNLM